MSYPLIPPVEQVIKTVIFSFKIENVSVNLFTSANISVSYLDDRGLCVGGNVFLMEGEDYALWNNDDEYLVEWVTIQVKQIQ
jgi:hypothetical protein